MGYAPAIGMRENFASTREKPRDLFEETKDTTAKLSQERQPFKYVIQQLNRHLAESQGEQAKPRAEIGLLQKRNTTYLDFLKRDIPQRETLLAAFRGVQERGCLTADDIHAVAAWQANPLDTYPEQRRINGSSHREWSEWFCGAVKTRATATGCGGGRTSSDCHSIGESTKITTESLGSTATRGSLPSNKRRRGGSEAGDERDNSPFASQRTRIDLNRRCSRGRGLKF